MTLTLLTHALAYASAGLAVFPCKPDKAPHTEHGLKDASVDPALIETWWQTWPDALIAGRLPENQMALDIDPRHGGLDTWVALKNEFGPLPETRAHYSGRKDGGGHVWWLRPPGKLTTKPLDQWARQHGTGHETEHGWTCGLDILHHNLRYSILPPSLHASTGRPYEWAYLHGLEIEPAEMPPWLVDLLIDTTPTPEPFERRILPTSDGSIADWYCDQTTWRDILTGWQLLSGDGETDGSKWRHPAATAPFSATVRHGCLFVYSPNTPFEETGADDPHGYTKFRANAILNHHGNLSAAAKWLGEQRDGPPIDIRKLAPEPFPNEAVEESIELDSRFPIPIDWPTFWRQDHADEQWLIEPFLALGRSHALYAPAKTGKSLFVFEQVAALATGNPTLKQAAGQPAHVVYLDYEMTEADIQERLLDMGYDENVDLGHLHYYLLPSLPSLDTAIGGEILTALARHDQAVLVVIDTTGRAVQGDENDADTVRSYYRHTGARLKQAGITNIRIDHAGKDVAKGQRGTSAKNDDVDVVWQLTAAGNGLKLQSTHRRVSWVPETVALRREDGPLKHVPTGDLWAAGYDKAAAELDRLEAPDDIKTRDAEKLLRESGFRAGNAAIRSAVKYRVQNADRKTIERLGAASGAPFSAPYNQIGDPEMAQA